MQFTRKGYIELLRDDIFISRHTVAEEAYESAYRHAEENGGGVYTIRYPIRELDLTSLTRTVISDTEAPTAPTLTATGGSGQVSLSWSTSTDNVGVRGYTLQWSTNPTSGFETLYDNTGTSYSHTGLNNNAQYYYQVSAYDSAGNRSAWTAASERTSAVGGTAYDGYTPTIYAAPTALGNGSGSSEANAMALTTALSAATLNSLPTTTHRVIGLLPGVYTTTPPGGRFESGFAAGVNGTAQSNIICVAKRPATTLGADWQTVAASQERTEFRSTITSTPGGLPTFGTRSSAGNYIQWVGIYANGTYCGIGPSSGIAVLNAANFSAVKKCVLVGQLASTASSDNYACIFVEAVNDCEISDNLFYAWNVAALSGGSGICTYEARGLEVVHNTFITDATNETGCIFKGNWGAGQSGCNFRYNVVRGICETGVIYGLVGIGSGIRRSYCEYNLFDGRGSSQHNPIALQMLGDYTTIPNTLTIRRNTLIGSRTTLGRGVLEINCAPTALYDSEIYDNIIYVTNPTGGLRVYGSYSTMTRAQFLAISGTSFHHNVGWNSTNPWAVFSDGTYTLEQMQSAGEDVGSFKLSSTTGVFEDYANGNYRPGSAVATRSSTGGPVGCYEVSGGEVPGHRV